MPVDTAWNWIGEGHCPLFFMNVISVPSEPVLICDANPEGASVVNDIIMNSL